MRLIPTILATLLLAAIPVSEAAAQDNSAVDEYSEHLPGGGGEQPSAEHGGGAGGAGGGGSGNGGGTPLPTDVVDEFEAAGTDGSAAAELAQSGGGAATPESAGSDPGADSSANGGGNAGHGSNAGQGSNASGGSNASDGGLGAVVSEVLDPGSGGSGLGIVLPIVLGAALLAAIALGIARIRGPKTPA